jgi:hypothetical protein
MHDGFSGKTRKKETIRRNTRGWEINIKLDPGEIEWGGRDWINMA